MGCGARASVAPTVNLQSGARVTPTDNHDRGEILVWVTKGDERKPRTFRLAAEGSLSVLGEHEGILIATTHGDLTWQAREKEVNLAGCDMDGGPGTPSQGTITMANLVNSSGDIVQKVVDPDDAEGDAVQDLQHHVALLGSIGPYLFIHESSFVYACGAHGNTMASAMTWDAESGKTIDLWSELPGKEKLVEVAKRKLDEEEDADPAQQDDSSKPEPAQLLPMYGERGALRIEAQFARWACYACSDGQWSSYTRSAVVPTDWIPERMRAWVTPPVVVKEFLEAHQDLRLGGWSRR